MKKAFIAAAILVVAASSSCKKEGTAQPVKIKVKSIGDVREHTGWERGDSTSIEDSGLGSSTLRTASPSTAEKAKKAKKSKK